MSKQMIQRYDVHTSYNGSNFEAEDEINWPVYAEVMKLMPIPESEG